jgi:hypothetical protein
VQDILGSAAKRNRVPKDNSEKDDTETNRGLTIHSLDLVHLNSTGLQGMEGCFDLNPPNGSQLA